MGKVDTLRATVGWVTGVRGGKPRGGGDARRTPGGRHGAAGRTSGWDADGNTEPRTTPSGLYDKCLWDVRTVRRQILRGRLTPRYIGTDDEDDPDDDKETCPICMLRYPTLNQSACCAARVCTECYLQIRPPRARRTACPFCKAARYRVAAGEGGRVVRRTTTS